MLSSDWVRIAAGVRVTPAEEWMLLHRKPVFRHQEAMNEVSSSSKENP